jgi:CHAD domain-containing protein
MSRKRKWIAVDSPHEPATRVARRALENRLLAVWDYLPSAAKRSDEDAEYVHQLRVSSRRAMAAVELFDSFLPHRRGEWFKEQLKKVRRTAGDARDFDVLVVRLEKALEGDSSAGARHLLDFVGDRRCRAQPAIRKIYLRLRRRHYKRRVAKLLKKLRIRDAARVLEPEFIEVARGAMRHTVNEFFSAARANLSDTANLHLLRIASKQVRYAMEIFAGAFPASFTEQLYPQVVELQEKLGEINDHVSALAHFVHWRTEFGADDAAYLLDRLAETETKLRDERISAFRQYWSPDRSERLRYQFTRELGESQLAIRPDPRPVAESG